MYSWYLGLVCFVCGTIFFVCCGGAFQLYFLGLGVGFGGWFVFDTMAFYLTMLSLFLLVSLLPLLRKVSSLSKGLILISICSSILSYCCVHALGFWVFYEMSILSLLFLLVAESPYSERFIAGWYLVGYVVLTSLPMLLCLFFLVSLMGSFSLTSWVGWVSSEVSVLVVLSVLFITKIPLPPFHIWLPIVHAEATSIVSVCLSGYIMKLGILGVCRFCYHILPDFVFSHVYMIGVLLLGSLFFFSACRELDGKRWLAFMSLSHILMACLCLFSANLDNYGLTFLYCMGHGFSAGVMFMFLWVAYDVVGSRNWGVLKQALPVSLMIRCLLGGCLCTVASLPPTVQFFCEISILSEASFISLLFVVLLFLFFFFGGLVPVVLFGGVMSRHYSVSFGGGYLVGGLLSVVFLVVWSFVMFVVC